jgi:periplasmic divalent cation tolerance protein
MTAVLLYTTWPDADEAEAAGRRLINEHLAACVNTFPKGRSIWRETDEIMAGPEVVMIVKTTDAKAESTCQRIEVLHPYDIPAVIALPSSAAGTSPAWVKWLEMSAEG